jgi:hypothetical protein
MGLKTARLILSLFSFLFISVWDWLEDIFLIPKSYLVFIHFQLLWSDNWWILYLLKFDTCLMPRGLSPPKGAPLGVWCSKSQAGRNFWHRPLWEEGWSWEDLWQASPLPQNRMEENAGCFCLKASSSETERVWFWLTFSSFNFTVPSFDFFKDYAKSPRRILKPQNRFHSQLPKKSMLIPKVIS